MNDNYITDRMCDIRHDSIEKNRETDREWTQSLEDKYNGMVKAIYATLGGMVVNLMAIIIVYILLNGAITK